LRREGTGKDERISKLEGELKSVRLEANKEKEQIMEEYGEQIHTLEETVATQSQQVSVFELLPARHVLIVFYELGIDYYFAFL